jgi:riboflavin biosynthesis pyrimidine reductase
MPTRYRIEVKEQLGTHWAAWFDGMSISHTASRQHRWTAQYIYPLLAEEYQQLRSALSNSQPPLNVIITASGAIDLVLLVFQSGEVPVPVVTTQAGAQRIQTHALPPTVQIVVVKQADRLSALAILEAVSAVRGGDIILVEGGPQLMGDFFAEHLLDELFLTLAPQVAGRDDSVERPGLVAGKQFAPEHPVWGTLMGGKRGGSHLFLRYAFGARGKRWTTGTCRSIDSIGNKEVDVRFRYSFCVRHLRSADNRSAGCAVRRRFQS